MTSLNLNLWYAASKIQPFNFTVLPPLKTLIITFLVVLHTKANKCGKNESERAGKALC